MVWETVREPGKKESEIVTDMMEIIEMIKNGDMEYLLGLVEMFIKEIMRLIWEVDLERCIGQMVAIIKEIGKLEYKMERAKYIFQQKVSKKGFFRIIK